MQTKFGKEVFLFSYKFQGWKGFIPICTDILHFLLNKMQSQPMMNMWTKMKAYFAFKASSKKCTIE
jgi:hypothetical protein